MGVAAADIEPFHECPVLIVLFDVPVIKHVKSFRMLALLYMNRLLLHLLPGFPVIAPLPMVIPAHRNFQNLNFTGELDLIRAGAIEVFDVYPVTPCRL
jgi:hypothetical protein